MGMLATIPFVPTSQRRKVFSSIGLTVALGEVRLAHAVDGGLP